MISIKKSIFIIGGVLCIIVAFAAGFFVHSSITDDKYKDDIPQNVRIDVKALVKQITISEVKIDDQQLKVSFIVDIKDDLHELIEQNIINTIYNVPTSGEAITRNDNVIDLIPHDNTIDLDFSKTTRFDLYFDISEQESIDIAKDLESINIKFVLCDDPQNVYEYVASYVYEINS